MPQNWTPIINPPKDGELVNSAITGRAIKSLQDRTDFLYQRINEFSAQNGKLVIQNADIDTDVDLGDWVYYNVSTSRYSKALAEGVYNNLLKQYTASDRTYVVGMVIAKSGGLAAILMHGWINDLSALGINVPNMIQSPEQFTQGRFYLSRVSPGKMTNIGGAPIVQLGFFSQNRAFICPLQKDIFESHIHYHFDLAAKPSASQNNDGSGFVKINNKEYVSYFYSDTQTTPPNILMCIKGNGAAPLSSYGLEFRFDLSLKVGGGLTIQIYNGADLNPSNANYLDPSQPKSGVLFSTLDINWPNYGEWIDIAQTGVSVAFVRQDGVYTNTLAQDVATSITGSTSKYKVYYPDDTTGWTNVNKFDGEYVTGTTFRYIKEFQADLNAVWPPVPTSSAMVTNNGINLVANADYKTTVQQLMWIPNGYTVNPQSTYAPWAPDYNSRTQNEDPDLSKRLEIFFSKANISTARPLVMSLQSATPSLIVRDCFTKEVSDSGNLEIDLRLDLSTIAGEPDTTCIAKIDSVSQKFVTSSLVSTLTAGSGIRILNSDNVSANSGQLVISNTAFQTAGEVSIVSLKNAKETLYGGVTPCVLFLPPSSAKCQIVSKVKIPQQNSQTSILLNLGASIFGTSTVGVGATALRATFKTAHYLLREGVNLNDFVDGNELSVQYWSIVFDSYLAYKVLDGQYPGSSNIAAGSSLNIGSSLQGGDIVLSVIERISGFPESDIVDTYSLGEVGFTELNWQIVS
jgi:hypothetical protein